MHWVEVFAKVYGLFNVQLCILSRGQCTKAFNVRAMQSDVCQLLMSLLIIFHLFSCTQIKDNMKKTPTKNI